MIRGNSGCFLEVLNNKEITKVSKDANYSSRLLLQCEKQKQFNKINKVNHVRSPFVLGETQDGGIFSFKMEYCNFSDFINFFDRSDENYFIYFINKIIELVDQYEGLCDYQEIDFGVIESKFNSSIKNLKSKEDKILLNKIFNSLKIEKIYIPVGICHGDFTLSNVLFSNEKEIILIDFLDCFLETPMQDIVKLRQDTYFYWSMQVADQDYDRVKMRIILNYIDKKLDENFGKKEYYVLYYKLFQFINLIRVLPYCQDNKLYDFLIRNIKNTFYE